MQSSASRRHADITCVPASGSKGGKAPCCEYQAGPCIMQCDGTLAAASKVCWTERMQVVWSI